MLGLLVVEEPAGLLRGCGPRTHGEGVVGEGKVTAAGTLRWRTILTAAPGRGKSCVLVLLVRVDVSI